MIHTNDYTLFLLYSVEELILGDVNFDHDKILQIYFTTNGTKDWVSVCYTAETIEPIAHVACRQSGFVGAMTFSSANHR